MSRISPQMRQTTQIVVLAISGIAILIPGIKSIVGFATGDYGKGGKNLFSAVIIVIVAYILCRAVLKAGQQTGNNINSQADSLSLIPTIAYAVTAKIVGKIKAKDPRLKKK